ncbi:acetate--CoA ligase [Apibacter sp. HY039]|uniref:acetate--CoA ligase n=1 Tax=Apibacter sp. HY039 TaxID=2501476 RepID=UPI000FEC0B16|nr:acetate--CoA ligase [Apibacter sp. HY039]
MDTQEMITISDYWMKEAGKISWFTSPQKFYSYKEGKSNWFEDGITNLSYLCIDKHIEDGYGENTAFIFDSPVTQTRREYTYSQIKQKVEKLAGGLKQLGLKKGDIVLLYMPMIPQTVFSILACARLGITFSVVYSGYSASELALRINDCKPKLIITATSSIDVDRIISYKPIIDKALSKSDHTPQNILLYNRKLGFLHSNSSLDIDFDELLENSQPESYVEIQADSPAYILYTSGVKGKARGAVYNTGDYAVSLKDLMVNIIKCNPDEVFFTAYDRGGGISHSFMILAPMINRNPSIIYEGSSTRTPDPGSYWKLIQENKVSVLLTPQINLRKIIDADPKGLFIEKYSLQSLNRIVLSGDDSGKDVIDWIQRKINVDLTSLWWTTEAAWPLLGKEIKKGTKDQYPDSIGKSVRSFDMKVVSGEGQEEDSGKIGIIAATKPLPPGSYSFIMNNKPEDLFVSEKLADYYNSGAGGYCDEEGNFYTTGNLGDVINVAGQRLSVLEIENIINAHPKISEVAVIGVKDAIKGQAVVAVPVIKAFEQADPFRLTEELRRMVVEKMGIISDLKQVVYVKRLPKTKSGSILRDIIRKIADGEEFVIPEVTKNPSVINEIQQDFQLENVSKFALKEKTIDDLVVKNRIDYERIYDISLDQPEQFWAEIAQTFRWKKSWDSVLEYNFENADFKWFKGGKLNITENCLDRHLEKNGDKIAVIWEPNGPTEPNRILTYKQLHEEVCKFANVLKSKGVSKGDRVCIYLPMVPELEISLLACARIGAIHSVVFAGFSSSALAARINDSQCKLLLTCDGNYRGNKYVDLKGIANEALENTSSIESVIVLNRSNKPVMMAPNRDLWWHDLIKDASPECPAEEMDAEDPLFILYTSGSTGKPKGMVHTCGGYMVYTTYSFKNVFQIGDPEDVYFCTADIGWITGHSFIVYAPLCSGVTSIMFEGTPSYPDFGRFWNIVDKYKVTHFYTAPTAIRSLEAQPLHFVEDYDLSSLKVLGSVGEPINEEAWNWYNDKVGKGNCPIADTWWQTETGGIMIAPLAGITTTKPTFATQPLPGIQPCLLDSEGKELKSISGEGNLCIKFPWPGMARTIYGDHQRYADTYFSAYQGKYFTGDGALRDTNGNYRITGRVDDVIIVSGHNLGTAPIENVINEHYLITESAVVGFPHDIKGNALYAFVITFEKPENEEDVRKEIQARISRTIGPIAKLDKIQFVPGLPRTRSGKIMRRILRKIASNELDALGDTSTLLNPEVVDQIIEKRI